MDENLKSEVRDYISAAGYLIIGTICFMTALCLISGSEWLPDIMTTVATGILLLCGIFLIILHKRDLTAVTFLMTGMFYLFASSLNSFATWPTVIVGVMFLILGLLIITAVEKEKYLLSILAFLVGLTLVVPMFIMEAPARIVLMLLIVVVCIYFAIAVSSEKITLPGADALRKDVVTDFTTSGSVLGYLLFLLNTLLWAAYYIFGPSVMPLNQCLFLDSICGLMMILTALLLLAVTRMRFTPAMFLTLGFLIYIGAFVTDVRLDYPIGIMFLVLAIIASLHNDSRVLVEVVLVLNGFCYLFASVFGEISSLAAGLFNIIPAIIMLYIAFAIFSPKKLPLF